MRDQLLLFCVACLMFAGCASPNSTAEQSLAGFSQTQCGVTSRWQAVDSSVKLQQIAVGGDGSVWATDGTNTYTRTNVNGTNLNGDTWSVVSSDRFSVVAVGAKNFVWGVRG